MDETIKRAKEIISLIQHAREYKNTKAKREEILFLSEDLVIALSEFIKYRIEAEQAYRQSIRELQEKESISFAAAENKAMTEEPYAIYKKTKLIYELAEEQIRILKIWSGSGY